MRTTTALAGAALLIAATGCGEDAGNNMNGVMGPPAAGATMDGPMAGATAGGGPMVTAGANAPPQVQPPPDDGNPPPDDGMKDPGEGMNPPPDNCQGLALEGMTHSPGGNVLPNSCEPFHPTTNNPYAIRCIDAWPWYKSGYLGDEYCILPPEPGKGIQVGFWPHGPDWYEQVKDGDLSGYQSPHTDWVLEAGEEETVNYQVRAPNMETFNYYRTYFRMRTGSHHNIITLHADTQLSGSEENGWIPSLGDALPGLFSGAMLSGILGGQQRPDDATPLSMDKPTEDAGYYLPWPARPYVVFNLHHFNTFGEPVLKEGWVNIWYEEDATKRVSWYMGLEPLQVISLSLSPGQTKDYHYVWNIGTDTRMVRVFGHRHFWTSNFSSWLERAGSGETELLYQSFDWFDMPTYRYDSVVQNPVPNADALIDGAPSGVVTMKAGDKLHFNCHMEFTDERAATGNGPTPREVGSVRFANEVYQGEMCIMFGNVAEGSGLGLPAVSSTPVPDFATKD